jgi:hypothetical protein
MVWVNKRGKLLAPPSPPSMLLVLVLVLFLFTLPFCKFHHEIFSFRCDQLSGRVIRSSPGFEGW